MKTFRASMILPLFGLLASLAACGAQAPSDGTGSTSSSVNTPAPGAQSNPGEHHFGMHKGHGPAGLLFAALHEPINLTTDQRTTIEALVATLKPAAPMPPPNDAHKTALVAAIRAGQIDTTALALDIKPELVDHSAREVALAKALTTLHDTLSSEQRSLLVMGIEKKMADGPKGGPDHKWNKNEKNEKNDQVEHKHPGGFGPMGMLKDLDLTKEQSDAIQAKLAANEPAAPSDADITAMKAQHETFKKEMDARLQTFADANFDATAFLAKPQGAPDKPAFAGKGPMDHMLKDLAVIVPLLTKEQREKLATKIEQGPKDHPHMTGKK